MMTQENMLSRYTILHELGRGATGAVYAARDRSTGAVVALKRIDPAGTPDAHFVDHFLEQARAARQLKHGSIVEVHDVGEAAGTAYVATEMLEGESLRKLLDAGPLPVARAIQIVRDVASGLAHAHLKGVVHGGIKPSNIIVLRSGAAKITDFGMAWAALSPEQARGDPVDHRGDIFALGALFYEMLTRRAPAEGKPQPPSELNQHVPRVLDAIVLSMLATQPADRMAGIPVLLRELQRLGEGLGLGAEASVAGDEPPASGPPASVPPGRREPTLRTPDPIRPGSAADEAFEHRKQIIDREVLDHQRAMMQREPWPPRKSGLETVTAVGTVLLVFALGFGGFMYFSSGPKFGTVAASRVQEAPPARAPAAPAPLAEATNESVASSGAWQATPSRAVASEPGPLPQKEVPATAVAAPRPVATPPPAEASKEPATPPAAPSGSGLTVPPSMVAPAPKPASAPVAEAAKEPEIAPAAPRASPPRAAAKQESPAPAKVAEPQPRGMAQLVLAVSPGGELYVNGEHLGTTPPITSFELEPGMHRIEVRSGSRKPYLTYMTVQPGDVRRITHDFNAKPSRPPGG